MRYRLQLTRQLARKIRHCRTVLDQLYPLIGSAFQIWLGELDNALRSDPHNVRTALIVGTEGSSFVRYVIVKTFALLDSAIPLAQVGIEFKASVCQPQDRIVIVEDINLWATRPGNN